MRLISVTALNADWSVQADGLDNDMVFRSGARAEAAALRLGEQLATAGERCEIRIHDRTDKLVGRIVCGPPVASERVLEWI
jgi:hypothetical protein